MFGQEYRLLPGRRMSVNGRMVRGYNNGRVKIGLRHRRLLFEVRQCGLQVIFDGNYYGMVQVVRNKFQNRVNGVCGTCDRNSGNDWRLKNGQRVSPNRGIYGAEGIGRSWSVPSDDGRVCEGQIRTPPRPPPCTKQSTARAASKCSVLMKHQVIFKACIDKHIIKENFKQRYSDCVMDVCALGHSSQLARSISCDSAKMMVDRCRAGGVQITNWRANYKCPKKKPPPPNLSSCEYKMDRGPCRASKVMYFFDTRTGSCQPFIYGGCGGNRNRFLTYTDCLTECGSRVKPKPNTCSSVEVSMILLQKLRLIISQLQPPAPGLTVLVSITNMMKQVTAQFQVIMKLFIQMRQMKQETQMLNMYLNLRQSIASVLAVVKKGINMRYTIQNNAIIKQNTQSITQIVSGFKLINDVYTGKQKTKVFVDQFDRVHINDQKQVTTTLTGLLQGTGKIETTKLEAMKVLMPTMIMSNLEHLGQMGFKGDMNGLTKISNEQMDTIQTITETVQKRVKVEDVIEVKV